MKLSKKRPLNELQTDTYNELNDKIKEKYVGNDWAYIIFAQILIEYFQNVKNMKIYSGTKEMPLMRSSLIGTAEGLGVSTISSQECIDVLSNLSIPKKVFLDPNAKKYIQKQCDCEFNENAPHRYFNTTSFENNYQRFENCIAKAQGDSIGDAFKVYYKALKVSRRANASYKDNAVKDTVSNIQKKHEVDIDKLEKSLSDKLRHSIKNVDALTWKNVDSSKEARNSTNANDIHGSIAISFQGSKPSSSTEFLNMHDISKLYIYFFNDSKKIAICYAAGRQKYEIIYKLFVDNGKVIKDQFVDISKSKNAGRELAFMYYVLTNAGKDVISVCNECGMNLPENLFDKVISSAKSYIEKAGWNPEKILSESTKWIKKKALNEMASTNDIEMGFIAGVKFKNSGLAYDWTRVIPCHVPVKKNAFKFITDPKILSELNGSIQCRWMTIKTQAKQRLIDEIIADIEEKLRNENLIKYNEEVEILYFCAPF